jgi:hypothetical protein
MSLWLAGFAGSSFDQSDWLKLLGVAGAAVALYVIARRLGGSDEPYAPPTDAPSSTQVPTSQTELPEPDERQDAADDDPEQPNNEEQTSAEEEDAQPWNIQIADWSFAKFEISAGPPDRDSFADELTVNLDDKSTGHVWQQTYLVATPAGLEKMLRESKSNFMSLPQVLVMKRYDVTQLRKAVLNDLEAIEEERGDVPPDATDAGEQD